VAVVALAMALFYTAGMFLNDVFDYEVDRRERPERPLPSGRITLGAARAAVAVLFLVGAALLGATDLAAAGVGLGLIALIVAYDAWHKGNPLSPALMAGCRALVYVIAGLAVADELPWELWAAAGMLFVYVVGLTQVAKVEGGGILGAWPYVAVGAPVIYWAVQVPTGGWDIVVGAFFIWVALSIREVRAGRIGRAVGALIAGIALFDACAVASVEGSTAAVLVCLAAFAATLALQTKISGT
jgi:UbiA prenyltransferase family